MRNGKSKKATPKSSDDPNRIATNEDILLLAMGKHKLELMDIAFLPEAIASAAIEGARPPRTYADWDSLLKGIAASKKSHAQK